MTMNSRCPPGADSSLQWPARKSQDLPSYSCKEMKSARALSEEADTFLAEPPDKTQPCQHLDGRLRPEAEDLTSLDT